MEIVAAQEVRVTEDQTQDQAAAENPEIRIETKVITVGETKVITVERVRERKKENEHLQT